MSERAILQNKECNAALVAENAGDLATAAAGFRRAALIDPSNPVPYLYLGHALFLDAQTESALQAYSLGADLDTRLLSVPASADPELAQRSALANERLRAHYVAQHLRAVDQFEQLETTVVPRIRAAIWCQTHTEEFEFLSEQRPQLFYVPGLLDQPMFDKADLPWLEQLESGFDALRSDFDLLVTSKPQRQVPYLQGAANLDERWEGVSDSLNWGTFPLYQSGTANDELVEAAQATMDLLADLPLAGVTKDKFSPREIVFSVLKPGQHIPPHFGLSNCGVTVHLPLVTEGDAGLRVASESVQWRQGQAVAFDDSFLHESWNRSASKRVNLLFEAWHPDLSGAECAAIEAVYEARSSWSASRRI